MWQLEITRATLSSWIIDHVFNNVDKTEGVKEILKKMGEMQKELSITRNTLSFANTASFVC